MLNYRRLVEFSSRVHTYLISLYIFDMILFSLTLVFPVGSQFISFVFFFSSLLSWLIFLEGAFIIIASLHLSLLSRVLVIKPIALTLLRIAVAFIFSFAIDFLNTFLKEGL